MKIHKYRIYIQDVQTVPMPAPAKPLSVGMQFGAIQMWVAVDASASAESQERIIYVVGTGHGDIPAPADFIGTVTDGQFVWHIFDGGPKTTPFTEDEWCKHYKELDTKYGTDPRSPLHHDNRCDKCKRAIGGTL